MTCTAVPCTWRLAHSHCSRRSRAELGRGARRPCSWSSPRTVERLPSARVVNSARPPPGSSKVSCAGCSAISARSRRRAPRAARPRGRRRARRRACARSAALQAAPISGPRGTPAASRSSPVICRRTWRTRLEPLARCGGGARRARPASAAASATASGVCTDSAARSCDGVAGARHRRDESGRGERAAHRTLAVARGELQLVEQAEDHRLRVLRGHDRQVQQQRGHQQQVRAPVRRQQRQRALGEVAFEAQPPARARASTPSSAIASSAASGVGFAERQAQLGADARARDGRQRAVRAAPRAASAAVCRLELEAEPRAVARESQQARGVVDEAALVQHAQATGVEILERVLDARAARPRCAPPSATAIALTVKSRRARSSSPLPGPHLAAARRARGRTLRGARRCRSARRPTRAIAVPKRSCSVTLAAGVALASRRPASSRANAAASRASDDVELARHAPEQQVAHGAADERDVVARSAASASSSRRRAARAARRAPRRRVPQPSRAHAARPRPPRASALAHRDPDGGQVRLGLGDGVAAVVEDRRAQHRVGARARAPRARCSSSPAPPEAITGTPTASLTACVSGRS